MIFITLHHQFIPPTHSQIPTDTHLIRLNKFITQNSEFSRRKADQLISQGEVFVNNQKVTQLGTKIDFRKDKVRVLGKQLIPRKEAKIYLALNKPKGYVTTRSDDLNRKTVMDLVPKIDTLKPAGRLDKDSEGLLLLSNDGEFINKFTHPKYECTKEYYIIIKGTLEPEQITRIEHGVRIEGRKTAKSKIKIVKEEKGQTILTIEVHEGRNRQIRKMFAYINKPVKYLQRIKINNILLGTLKKGAFRKLTKTEINDI